jgi:hypothetical protein
MTDNGAYDVQPDCAAPPGEEAGEHVRHRGSRPVAHHVELGERHVGRADLERHHEAPKPPTASGRAPRNTMMVPCIAELVVELRQHDAARRLVRRTGCR